MLIVISISSGTAERIPDETVHARDGSTMRRVPGGTFVMGSAEVPPEKPPHKVTLPPYWISKYEVTNAQFRRFVKATGHQTAARWEARAMEWGENAPVVRVSWHDAVAYCAWAGLRLPTEAEWEFAARGRDGRQYPWGNQWDARRCRNSVGGAHWGSAGRPAVVGSYPSGVSPFGCLDMAGNVWEWCSSRYVPYPYNAADVREAAGGSHPRVYRGGSWGDDHPIDFRSGHRRFYMTLDVARSYVGFRCAKDVVR